MENTNDEGIRQEAIDLLAVAYASSAGACGSRVEASEEEEASRMFTAKEQVEEAESRLAKAESLGATDSTVLEGIKEVKQFIANGKKRRFRGNYFVAGLMLFAGLALMFGALSAEGPGGPDPGSAFIFLVLGGLYIASCMTPQYKVNRMLLKGKPMTFTEQLYSWIKSIGGEEWWEGAPVWVVLPALGCGFALIVLLLPIVIVYNFVANYAIG